MKKSFLFYFLIFLSTWFFISNMVNAGSITFTKPNDYQVIANVHSGTMVEVEIDYSWVQSYWSLATKRILRTDDGDYDSSGGGVPYNHYRTTGSYTWTIELWELNVGGYWVKTAEDEITFYVNFMIYARNNFGSGNITLEGSTKSSGSYVKKYTGYSVGAATIDQSDYIWNTSGTNNSEWDYKPHSGDQSGLGVYSRSISYTVQSDDNGAALIAGMRLNCSVTFQNSLPGMGNGGVIKVGSTQYNSPTSSFTVVENNPKAATAINQTIDNIQYTFDEWSNGSGNITTTFYPNQATITYTANYNAKPIWTNRNLHTNSTPGAYITVDLLRNKKLFKIIKI